MAAVLQQARDFLSRIVDWDGENYVNIHYFVQKPGYTKRFMQGSAVQTVDEAIRQLVWLANQAHAQDVYFCTSTQSSCEEKQIGGKALKVAVRNRDQAVRLKALFLDIDVGKEGGYATPAEAVAALKKFIVDTGLPPFTAAVASGTGGFHVYWIAEQPWEVTSWQPLADAMVAAAKASGLICDTQCTVDAVRILRVPQTRNFKTNPPSPVVLKSLQPNDIPNAVIEQALAPFMSTGQVEGFLPRREGLVEEGDEFAAGIEVGAAPRDIDEVAIHCAWIRDTLENGGADNDNPKWFLSLRAALFCREPDETGHRLSCGHPGYLHEETQQELVRLRSDRDRNPRIGFPSCKAISAAGAPQCATCPLFADGKSPLSAVKPSQVTGLPAVVINPFLPDGYRVNALGVVMKDEVDESGRVNSVEVFRGVISDPAGIIEDGKWHIQFFNTYGGGRKQTIKLAFADLLANKDSARRTLASVGITTPVSDKTMEFLMSFLDKLRNSKEGVSDVKPYGWSFSKDEPAQYLGFAYAGKCFGTQGDIAAPIAGGNIYKIYRPTGSIAHWQEAAKIITAQKRPALDALLASAFAGPLVALLNLQGVCIGGISSASGVGKTTTLQIAAAVWGDPIAGKITTASTSNSVFNRAANIVNLPLFYDEIKGVKDTEEFLRMMFTLTNGSEKGRSNRNGDIRDQKTFATMLAYATNESLYDTMLRQTAGTNAGYLRMFEFEVPPIAEGASNAMLATLVGKLSQNHGQAGMEYARYIGTNYDQVVDMVESTKIKWSALVEAKDEERFWVGACTTLIVGAKIANLVGLTEFDEVGLRKFLFTEFMKKRAEKAESPNDMSKPELVASILGDFLASKAREFTLVTNQIMLMKGRPRAGAIKVHNNADRLRIVEVQYGRDNGILRISDMALGEWLRVKGYPKGSFCGALKKVFNATTTYARLGSGTEYSDPVTRLCWQISIPGTPLEDLVEYEVAENDDAKKEPAKKSAARQRADAEH